MNKRKVLQLALKGVGLVTVGGIVAACSKNAPEFSSIDVTGAEYARDFALTDHNGKGRSLKDFAGKIVVMFFGFVHCEDVCPTTLADLARVKQLLGRDGERLQVLFVTVDPERDNAAVLKDYVVHFDSGFLGLYTDPINLAVVAKEYRVYYKKVSGHDDASYGVDHTAGTYVYDTRGKFRLYAAYPVDAKKLAADIGLLLKA